MLTFALQWFLFFKAAVFKLKLEKIRPQMAVVVYFFLIHYFEERSEWVAVLNPYVKCVLGPKE